MLIYAILYVCQVNKKPGKETVELLDEEEPKKGLWDSISRFVI
jgi:hypothetical protein